MDMKNMINIDVMKCYSLLLKKDGLINNIGNYILLFTIFFFIISSIIFSARGFKFLLQQINNIMEKK